MKGFYRDMTWIKTTYIVIMKWELILDWACDIKQNRRTEGPTDICDI